MSSTEIIELGLKAERLLQSEDFLDIYDNLSNTLGKQILATSLTESAERDVLYSTFNGMRYYLVALQGLVNSKNQLILNHNEEDELPQDDADDHSGI